MAKKRPVTMPLETERPVTRVRPFPPRRDYASLSVKDLLDAREAYHVYLSTLENVVATAIGRYLIHKDDWYAVHPPDVPRPPHVKKITEARTLVNSRVRPWSWPAVLVFVRRWQQPGALGDNVVPPTLYLADGRVVPTCVIEAPPDEDLAPPASGPAFNSPLLGGGYSCARTHQGQQSLGTFACLVRKGGTYYALTNKHVAGGEGEVVRARIRGEYVDVGVTSGVAVDRIALSEVFPDWSGARTYLAGDAGLVRINDIQDWTSQVFGIGEIGEVFDATKHSVTLDLIDCPVRAFGGSSGVAEGQIRALFFKYQSLGGYEYATDVLIGPRLRDDDKRAEEAGSAAPFTRPGDSGTLWFYDPPEQRPARKGHDDFPESVAHVLERGARARRLRPIAMQWGGQRILSSDGSASSYGLAAFLSSICRQLDVEIVRDWSTGHDEYWGKIGHFAIGWKACGRFNSSSMIGRLFESNQVRIGFGDETLGKGAEFRMGRGQFVPLSDVPDYVWIPMKGARRNEGVQHFADIDIYDIDGGPTLLERCVDEPEVYLSAARWKTYFDGFAAKGVGPEEGALPFRVWQLWEAMVGFLKGGDVLRYVAAAGVLAHYVGDASQPMHCSYLHHGAPPMKKVGSRRYPIRKEGPDAAQYKAWKKTRAADIHGVYEQGLFEVDAVAALADVDEALGKKYKVPAITSGYDAAHAVIQLMADAQRRLSPQAIINADDPTLTPKPRAQRLWNNKKIRRETVVSLSNSVQLLAALWKSAWEVGKGNKVAKAKIRRYKESEIEPICRSDKKFLPSLSLKQMADSGNFEPSHG